MTMLETLALTLHRSVCSDPEAQWRDLSQEDRDDALQWARDALESLRGMAEQAGGSQAVGLFIEAVLSDAPEGRG